MKINLIVARAMNGVIGVGPDIPWKLVEDFQNFKHLTEGQMVVMGRKTHESIGRALPNRYNVVITSKPCNIKTPRVVALQTLSEAIELAKNMNVEVLWVIGGEALYQEAFPIVDEMHITEVHKEIPYKLGDPVAKFIVDIDRDRWVQTRNTHRTDEGFGLSFTFNVWKRRCRPHLYANDWILYEPEKFCKVEESPDEFIHSV